MASSAYLIGRDGDHLAVLERAFQVHRESGRNLCSIRCAFWLGLHLLLRGETGQGSGWFARARRLLDGEDRDCVEAGYLLVPGVLQRIEAADWETAYAMATDAADIGNRFEDADLIAAARHLQGRILLRKGQVERGLALLDKAMVSVTAGETSPIVTGLIYCGVIASCQQVYALGRAREWTEALHEWCAKQPELVFAGPCLVHRAEIMRLGGAWPNALEEARRARERLSQVADAATAGAAFYQEAEVHRLRGAFAAAEAAYRSASECGYEPQPGLALLRLAQGRTAAALGAIKRAAGGANGSLGTLAEPPFYGIELHPAGGASAGLLTDACGRVIHRGVTRSRASTPPAPLPPPPSRASATRPACRSRRR